MATSKIHNQRENPFIFNGYKNTPFDCNNAPAGMVYCNNAVANIPVTGGGFLLTLERTDSWKTQLYLTVTSASIAPNVYKRVYDTNAWGDWFELYSGALGRVSFPTINTTGYIDPGGSNATLKLNVQNYSRILFLLFGTSANRMGTLMINVNSAGSVYRLANLGSDFTTNVSTNHLEISCNTASVGFYVHPIIFSGGFTVET